MAVYRITAKDIEELRQKGSITIRAIDDDELKAKTQTDNNEISSGKCRYMLDEWNNVRE